MNAVRIHEYGNVDVLKLEETPLPRIGVDELLIKIFASSVNPVDWKVREGHLQGMKLHHLPLTLGWDVSGVVEKTGSAVTNFKVGDEVFTRPAIERDGSYAEYIAVKADDVARKPRTVSHLQAAVVPLAGLAAWESLVQVANIQPGQKVLIHAGSGGVGHLAVQLAKAKGAYVIATASTRNVVWVKSLGADEVIDYKTQQFDEIVSDVDVVFDTVGGETQADSWKVLKKNGILVSITNPPDEAIAAKHGVRSAFVFIKPNASSLQSLAELIDAGKIQPHIDRIFSLEQIKEAQTWSQSGHSIGKIAIEIVHS
jgi:NADPH:quinone reductase-like Zn-dependent oxidoreductase